MSSQTFLNARDQAEWTELLRWYNDQLQQEAKPAAPVATTGPASSPIEGPDAMARAGTALQLTGLPDWWKRTEQNIWEGWNALVSAPETAWEAVRSAVQSGKLASQGEGGHALAEAGGAAAQALEAGFGVIGFPFTPFIAPVKAAFEEAAGILPGADAPLDLRVGGVDIKLTPRQIAGIVGMSVGVAGAQASIPKGPKVVKVEPAAAEVPPVEGPPALPPAKGPFVGQEVGPSAAPGQRFPVAALGPAPETSPIPRVSARELLRRADTLEAHKGGLGERGKAVMDEQITALRDAAEQAAVVDLAEQSAATALRTPEIWDGIRSAVAGGKLLLPPGRSLADLSEVGRANLALTYALGRATVGALYGGTQGDTLEERIQNGLLFAGLGAALSPRVFREFSTTYAKTVEGLMGAAPGAVRFRRGGPRPGINLDRVGAAPDVKQTMKTVYELSKEKIAGQQERVTHEQTIAEAQARPLTVEEALALNPETIGKEAPRETNLRDLSNAASRHVTELVKKTEAGDVDALAELPNAVALAGELAIRDKAFGTNVARSLEARKILSDADRSTLRPSDLADLQERIRGTGLSPEALVDRLRQLPQPIQRLTFIQNLVSSLRTGQSWIREAFINGLLSGPPTQIANALGNVATTVWQIPERFMAEGYRAAARAAGSEVYGVAPGEAVAIARSIPEGTLDGIRLLARLGQEAKQGAQAGGARGLNDALMGIEAELRGKLEWDPAIKAPQWAQDRVPNLALAFDYLGHLIRTPGTGLGVVDAVAKAINFRTELKAQSLREGYSQGFRGAELAEKVQAIEESLPSHIVKAANDWKMVQTFQNDLEGGLGGAASQILTGVNSLPLGFTVTPFIRATINIPRWAGQRTPILNLASTELRRDLATAGAPRDLAVAKLTASAMIASAVAYLVASGRITGGGPKDQALRDMRKQAGKPPYSFRTGTDAQGKPEWQEYSRMDPEGFTVGTIADFMEIVAQVPEMGALEGGSAIVMSIFRQIDDKPYFMGIVNMVDAIQDPINPGERYLKGLARASVPAGVRLVERLIDPTLREADTVVKTLRANTPGYSDTLSPRRNRFGEVQLIPEAWGPDWLSPVFTHVDQNDPVAKEMDRLGVKLEKLSRIFAGTNPPDVRMQPERMGEGIELNDKEFDFLVRMAGNELKDSAGRGMKDRLADLIQTDTYQRLPDGPDGGKAKEVQRIVQAYDRMARIELLRQDSALRVEWEAKLRQRALSRTPAPRTQGDVLSTLGR